MHTIFWKRVDARWHTIRLPGSPPRRFPLSSAMDRPAQELAGSLERIEPRAKDATSDGGSPPPSPFPLRRVGGEGPVNWLPGWRGKQAFPPRHAAQLGSPEAELVWQRAAGAEGDWGRQTLGGGRLYKGNNQDLQIFLLTNIFGRERHLSSGYHGRRSPNPQDSPRACSACSLPSRQHTAGCDRL